MDMIQMSLRQVLARPSGHTSHGAPTTFLLRLWLLVACLTLFAS